MGWQVGRYWRKRAKEAFEGFIVLNGYDAWFLAVREEYRLRCFRIGCRGECLYTRGNRLEEAGENCVTVNFIICTSRQILLR
jgi:hypothetical protein